MSLQYGDTRGAILNRKVFLDDLGIDYHDLVCAKQVHGDYVRIVSSEEKGRGASIADSALEATDALITSDRKIPIAIFTADCLSVFLYDTYKHVIALAHAGWKGSRSLIVPKTIGLMCEHFNTNPNNVLVGFGPSIRACCYEVGEEFNGYFKTGINQKNNRIFLDLIDINKKQMLAAGINNDAISDSGICTFCNSDEFFSYRKEGYSTGRIMSVMMLK